MKNSKKKRPKSSISDDIGLEKIIENSEYTEADKSHRPEALFKNSKREVDLEDEEKSPGKSSG